MVENLTRFHDEMRLFVILLNNIKFSLLELSTLTTYWLTNENCYSDRWVIIVIVMVYWYMHKLKKLHLVVFCFVLMLQNDVNVEHWPFEREFGMLQLFDGLRIVVLFWCYNHCIVKISLAVELSHNLLMLLSSFIKNALNTHTSSNRSRHICE